MRRRADAQHDQKHHDRQRTPETQRQIRHEDEDGPPALERVLVGRLAGRRRRGRVLAARAEAYDAARDRDHPEHAEDGDAVRGRGENPANDDHGRRRHDGHFAAQVVARQADDDLAEDFADEEGVGNLGAHGGGVLFFVLGAEEDVGHGPGFVSTC